MSPLTIVCTEPKHTLGSLYDITSSLNITFEYAIKVGSDYHLIGCVVPEGVQLPSFLSLRDNTPSEAQKAAFEKESKLLDKPYAPLSISTKTTANTLLNPFPFKLPTS